MPLHYNNSISSPTNIIPSSSESLTANIEFGITKKYFMTSPVEGRNVVTLAATEANTPIITFSALGKGKVFFYGILDEDKAADASFAKSPAYFVFWKRIADFATNTPSIKNLNYQTGNVINFNEEQNIQTPNGRISTKSLGLDNIGLYTLKDRIVAINLINDRESDVEKEATIGKQGFAQSSDKFKEKVPYELIDYLIIIAIIILLIEFLYIKIRGDL
jgi:hypothetical protein